MRRIASRREFLKNIPVGAAGALAGAAGISPLLLARAPEPPNPSQAFNMVTLGDSIMWGQGLPENMKFRNIVQQWLQSQYKLSWVVNQIPTHAHSGAKIIVDDGEGDNVTGLPGEIPSGHPSITKQVDLTQTDLMQARIDPHTVDLVLLDGGINDVGIFNILWPTNGTGLVQKLAEQKCVGRMKALLPFVMNIFPNAAIVITGYFPIASHQSDIGALTALIAALAADAGAAVAGVTGGVLGFVGGALSKDQIVNNSETWNNEAQSGLSNLINQLQPSGNPRLALAWPDFQSENCYAAPQTYLWKVGQFTRDEAKGVEGKNPESSTTVNGVAWTRARACAAANRASPTCDDASLGHPNVAGAHAYADAIIGQLQHTLWPRLGLPAPPPPPRKMNVNIVQQGTEQRGGVRWLWLIVAAMDAQTGIAVKGARVQVNGENGTSGSGLPGQKIYYICKPKLGLANKPINPNPTGPGPHDALVSCNISVAAPGYSPGILLLGEAENY
jgi:hypothetical protein